MSDNQDRPTQLGFSAFQDTKESDPKAFQRPGTSTPKPQWTRGQRKTADSTTYRVNQYPGKCDRCSRTVGAEEGIAVPPKETGTGRWGVRHLGMVCPAYTAPEPVEEPTEASTPTGEVHATIGVPDGKYTIVFDDDSHVTLRVHTQDTSREFKPGVQLISYLYGRDNTSDFKGFAEFVGTGAVHIWRKFAKEERLIEATKVLVADPKAASSAYGLESRECGLCGRELTNPESLAVGIGPTCAKKAGW